MAKNNFPKRIASILLLLFCSAWSLFAQTPEYFYGDSASNNSFPLNTNTSNKTQWLYIVSEFNTAPPPQGLITKVYFRRAYAYTNSSTFQNLTVKIGAIPNTQTQFANSTFLTSNMQQVFMASTYTIAAGAIDEWFELELDTPFLYDGVSNLVVEMSQSGYTGGVSIRNVLTGTTNRRIFGLVGSTSGSLVTGPVDIGFDMSAGNVDVLDIGVDEIVLTEEFCFGESQDATLTIKNFGVFQVDTFNVGWSINGLPQTPFGFNQLIDTAGGAFDETVDITLTGLDFPDGDSEVKFWTYLPNNEADENDFNDTMTVNVLAKSFTSTFSDILCEGDTLVIADTFFTEALENYELLLSSIDGCDSTVVIDLTFNPSISYAWDGTTMQLCDGDNYTLSAQHPHASTFLWNDLSTGAAIVVNSSGTYSVQVADGDGVCTATASMDFDFKPLPQINLFPTETIYCEGDTVVLNAGPEGVSYLWSTNETTSSIKVGESGVYHVLVESMYGCQNTESIELNFYAYPGFDSWEYIELGNYKFQFILENPADVIAYHWDFGDGHTSTLPQPIHQYEGPGVYTVFLTIESMCSADTFYKIMEMSVDIDEIVGVNNHLKVYPNPAKDILEINIEDSDDAIQSYRIMDAQGRLVHEDKNLHQEKVQINIEHLSMGTYFIEVVTKEHAIQRKFIKN